MNETRVVLTRRQSLLQYILEAIRYANPKQPIVKRGKLKVNRALYSVSDLVDRTGHSASTVRSLLGTLYGRGQATVEIHGGCVYWRATVAKEREAL